MRVDDSSQLVVVTLELLRVHQQFVSEFSWCFTQHYADFQIIIRLRRREFLVDVPDVHVLHASSNFAGLSSIPGCNTACNIANLRPALPAVFGAFPPPTVSRLRTRFCSALAASNSKLSPVVSVVNMAYRVWLSVRMSTEDWSVPAGTFATG